MDLNHLKYFYTVAREGSFTKASRLLRVQQPAISKVVKMLESEIDLELFERTPKGVRLTASGEEIFRICRELFERVETIREYSESAKKGYKGPLSFGVTDAAAAYIVPKALKSYVSNYPDMKPSIFSGSSNLIYQELLDDRIEFGIFFTTPDSPAFEVSELVDVPFKLVTSPQLQFDPAKAMDFVISREIDYPRSKPFPVLEMLNKRKVKVNVGVSCNNLDAQRRMVKEGLGVALLPGFMVRKDLSRGTLVEVLSREGFSYPLRLATRKSKRLSRGALAFLEEFKETSLDILGGEQDPEIF